MTPRTVRSWALYDWANSAYATVVLTALFPRYFKAICPGDDTVSTFRLGVANSTAGLLVALLAPFLGAVADRAGARKRLLLVFTGLGVVMTAGLFLISSGDWLAAAAIYVLATVGFSGGVAFNDSLLVSVAPPAQHDRVSLRGYAYGYLGGGIAYALCLLAVQFHARLGVTQDLAVRLCFVGVALWWAGFTIPLLCNVPEHRPAQTLAVLAAVRGGGRQLLATLRAVRRLPTVGLFLLGYWLYIDGVDTVVRMAVDYGLSLGFADFHLMIALLLVQLIGFPATLLYHRVAQRLGIQRAIGLAILVYIGITLWGGLMDSVAEFYGLALAVSLVQGGIQALSRSFYARMIPVERSAEFFGFYNMIGKFAVVLGPVLMGGVARATGSHRLGIVAVAVLFVAGGILFSRVDAERARGEFARL